MEKKILPLSISNLFLLILLLVSFIFYLPALSISIQGDDLPLLWHVQVPVSIFQMPFTGWDLPIAGRFGYGEALYAGILFKLFGLQIPIFNLAGIFIKLIVIISVYMFSIMLTKIRILSLMAATLFAFSTIGVDSTFSFFLHFSSGLAAFFFFGLILMFKSYENRSLKTWLIGTSIIIIGAFLMLPRAFGIILLPLWTLFRYNLIPTKLRNYSIFGTFIVLGLLAILVWILPGAKETASINTFTGFEKIVKDIISGNNEPLRAFFVSLGSSLLPSSVYYSFAQFLTYDYKFFDWTIPESVSNFLFPWSMLIWTAFYGIFVLPLIQRRKKISSLDIIGFLSGISWSMLILILYNNNHPIFYGGEVIIVVLGIDILLLMIFLGLQYLSIEAKIGSILLICASAIPTFYFPTWIHDPMHVSSSSFRYLTLSSGFVAIGLACLIYILYLHKKFFFSVRKSTKGTFFSIITIIFFVFILNANFQQTKTVMAKEITTRQIKVFLSNWDFVRSHIDFTKTPLIVIVWTDGDIFDVKREFFHHEGLALISKRPWTTELPTQLRLHFNFKDSLDEICIWKNSGTIFNPNNLYVFKLKKDLSMEARFEEGREKLKTWDKYCSDTSQLGIEAGEPI